nr:hypothetical protein [Tanacetum cinerariifolium]
MESEVDRVVPDFAAGSSKKGAEKELNQWSSKRQKTNESSKQAEAPRDKDANDCHKKKSRMHWKIIKVGNHTEVYQVFEDMLKTFNRDDLVNLWSLVQERFNSTDPTKDKEIEIWVELKRLFKPDTNDELWESQKHIHDITCRLYDTCGVHHVSTKDKVDIYMLVEREYPLSSVFTQMLSAKTLGGKR